MAWVMLAALIVVFVSKQSQARQAQAAADTSRRQDALASAQAQADGVQFLGRPNPLSAPQ